MNIRGFLFLGATSLFAASLFAQTANAGSASKPAAPQAAPSHDANGAKQRDGNDVFAANCSRCHNAPESFSPSVSGTIIRHMRVRAGLSKEDEQAILRFLNP
jgi:cytochrome c5